MYDVRGRDRKRTDTMKRIAHVRRRLYEVLNAVVEGDKASRAFGAFIVLLIAMNIVAIVLESVQRIGQRWQAFLDIFELVSVIIFSVEYVLRLWSCTAEAKYSSPVLGRLRFALRPMIVIDLLAVGPFYLPFVGVDLRFVRALRLFRLFRVVKLGRYSTALQTLGRVLISRKEELGAVLFALLMLLLIGSCTVYFAEHEARPEAFPDIPEAMRWALATLTAADNGNAQPITPVGKAVAGILVFLRIGMFALLTGILGAGFVEQVQKRRAAGRTCPHCGKDLPP